MALDPNIILRGVQGFQQPDLGAAAQQGLKTVGIFQKMQNEQELAPLRQEVLQAQAAGQALANKQRQADILEATRKRDLRGLASSYLQVKGAIDAGNYTEAADQLEKIIMQKLQAGQTVADLSDTIQTMETLRSNDSKAIAAIKRKGEGIVEQARFEGLIATKAVTPKQRGTGALEGYIFNPDTGVYSIDPAIKSVLAKKAEEAVLAGKQLGLKDKQAINKELTGMLKDTVKIKRAAEELDKLEELKSPAAKLGAVFKFMKALDPTSVVRETEQGQVYAATGVAGQLAGAINSLLGQGKLTDEGFRDLVRTSKAIANANIESVGGEVLLMLEAFGDSLPDDFRDKLEKRIPVAFDLARQPKEPENLRGLSDADLLEGF